MDLKINSDNGMIQFASGGKIITTSINNLTLVKDGGKNIAFYGAIGGYGRSTFSDEDFELINIALGFRKMENGSFITESLKIGD